MSESKQAIPTIIERFYHWEKETPDEVFLRQPKGSVWKEITFAEAGCEARKMLSVLQAAGLQKGDHVGICSKNCYHWVLADLSILMGGFVSVPFYPSLPKDELAQVISLADLKAIFLGKLDDWGDRAEAIPEDIVSVKFPHYEGNAEVTVGDDWNALIANVEPCTDNFSPDLDDLWTIKFTSGTTGTPKGVMHVHRSPSLQMVNELKTGWVGMERIVPMRLLSYLPLNHVGERMGLEVPALWQGGSMSFVESLDTFAQNLKDTQPTVFFSVPRIWNKFYLSVISKLPPKRLDLLLKIPVVSGIVKKKLREAMGLRDVIVASTGAAITPAFVKEFFRKLDVHLVEAYGMTEVCGAITHGVNMDTPSDSVGQTIPFGEIKIHPESGEILMKSPYMMTGYYKEPQKTAEVLIDGWMHSGDKGTIDAEGYVRVIGRVKDAFKTSKGKYVSPNPLEEVIMGNDYIEQVCVVGLGIAQPLALVNLSEIGISEEKQRVEASIRQTIDDLNAARASYERVASVVVIDETWSMENKLLTPTLKVRRTEVDERYGPDYASWSESKQRVIWRSSR